MNDEETARKAAARRGKPAHFADKNPRPPIKSDDSEPTDGGEKRSNYILREAAAWVETILIAAIIAGLIDIFFIRMITVRGDSMNPTLASNDRLISFSWQKDFERGDIVAIDRHDADDLIKRVIAVAGDTVDIDFSTGEVTVNGEVLDEPYIYEKTENALDFAGEAVVPPGHVFVMGDNRNNSDDSRDKAIGFVDVKNIFGKAAYRVFPFDKFGGLK